MDKYTVDLDKVLNDFEYSELTTEVQNVTNEPAVKIISPYPNTSRLKHNTAKHSINTVFNSLNEYVNSDITPKSYSDNLVPEQSFQIPVGNSKTADNVIVSHDLASQATVLRCDETDGIVTTQTESVNVNLSNKTVEELIVDDIRDISTLSTSDLDKIADLKLELEVQGDISVVSNGTKHVDNNLQSETVENLKTVEEISHRVTEETAVDNKEPNIDLEELISVEKDIQPEIADIVPKELPDCIEEINPIGFDSAIDLDDSELNKYLEELERELEEKESEEIVTNETANIVEIPELSDNNTLVGNNDNNTLIESNDNNTLIENNDNNTLVGNNDNNLIENNDNNSLVGNNDNYSLVVENNDNQSVVLQEEENNAFTKETATLLVENSEIATVVDSEVTERRDSLQDRPTSLEIDNSEPKRPINLIGNPGSTPYNNVYVSKELNHQHQHHHHHSKPATTIAKHTTTTTDITTDSTTDSYPRGGDTDSSSASSMSPTFSEASTNSVQSTDSTDDMETDDNNKLAKQQQQQQQMENNNVVNTSDNNSDTNPAVVSSTVVLTTADGSEVNVSGSSSNVVGDSETTTTVLRVSTSGSGSVATVMEDDGGLVQCDSDGDRAANNWLGREPPVWIPDAEALNCLHCDMKFTVIKRRHHCRACGLVLCSRCCNTKHHLPYLNTEARVCGKCHEILLQLHPPPGGASRSSNTSTGGGGDSLHGSPSTNRPNPNNPMDYCSLVPPLEQQGAVGGVGSGAGGGGLPPPTVMVPVGVLKRNNGSNGNKSKSSKSVMFCDGIRPGSDLTNLDNDFNYNDRRLLGGSGSSTTSTSTVALATGGDVTSTPNLTIATTIGTTAVKPLPKVNRNFPDVDRETNSFIPSGAGCLPPTVTVYKSEITYTECGNTENVVEMLKNDTLSFAVQNNLHVNLKIVNLDCCINKSAWCFSTEGLMSVGQDEILILLEMMENEKLVPKDIFYHLNNVYNEAVKGSTVSELGLSMHNTSNFLDSKSHVGFLYIRPSFQCLQKLNCPKESYLIGILIHRWETPWAKIFPLRLVLRLGAEYRYYPSPIISTRHRDSVFVEIGHTIINILADFRNFSYTLPHIRGLTIHMEEKKNTVKIPINRYDQVMKCLNNSSEHILAFGGNFSAEADSHLVCIQNKNGSAENTYTTHAININNKPRKLTGASFIVFNGALKSTSGLTAKSSIVEDGLMIQIHAEEMIQVREHLRNMKDYVINCGAVGATTPDETIHVVWCEPDVYFNIGVKSMIDDTPLSGIPSIRVHNGKDYVCNSGSRLIRWTEVFILQNGEENAKNHEPVDISKLAENIARATCTALVKYLDLLASNNFYKVGIRTNLHIENVSYSAGSNGIKLPPIYMKSLDNELVPVLHRITANNSTASAIELELAFRILNV